MSMRPHDLLWPAQPEDLQFAGTRPVWLDDGWLAQVPVVVRREQVADAGLLPVGIRGRQRHERLAAYLPAGKVLRLITPEQIAQDQAWRALDNWRHLPCMTLLDTLASQLAAFGLPWGITGGVGFALATGLDVLRPGSDIDVLLRAAAPLPRRAAADLLDLLSKHPVRIDVQVDTGYGAFALAEWAAGRDRLLLKTAAGPLLLAYPWHIRDAEHPFGSDTQP